MHRLTLPTLFSMIVLMACSDTSAKNPTTTDTGFVDLVATEDSGEHVVPTAPLSSYTTSSIGGRSVVGLDAETFLLIGVSSFSLDGDLKLNLYRAGDEEVTPIVEIDSVEDDEGGMLGTAQDAILVGDKIHVVATVNRTPGVWVGSFDLDLNQLSGELVDFDSPQKLFSDGEENLWLFDKFGSTPRGTIGQVAGDVEVEWEDARDVAGSPTGFWVLYETRIEHYDPSGNLEETIQLPETETSVMIARFADGFVRLSFSDNVPIISKHMLDGTESWRDTLSVDEATLSVLGLAVNPANDTLAVLTRSPAPRNLYVMVYDTLGQQTHRQTVPDARGTSGGFISRYLAFMDNSSVVFHGERYVAGRPLYATWVARW